MILQLFPMKSVRYRRKFLQIKEILIRGKSLREGGKNITGQSLNRRNI